MLASGSGMRADDDLASSVVGATYTQGAVGSNECPSGSVPLSDGAECEAAAAANNIPEYKGEASRTDRQGGCWVGTAGKANWNPLPGIATSDRYIFCKPSSPQTSDPDCGAGSGDKERVCPCEGRWGDLEWTTRFTNERMTCGGREGTVGTGEIATTEWGTA